MDTIGTEIFVLISEVSLFLGENNVCLYKVGTRSSVLINQVSLFKGCPVLCTRTEKCCIIVMIVLLIDKRIEGLVRCFGKQ